MSVSDKTGLEKIVEVLGRMGVEIVASSGTAVRIQETGYGTVMEVSKYTGHPESPDGLLKTLHPKIHGGLLLNHDDPRHRAYMDRHGILPFDLVVINLYPFQDAVKGGVDTAQAAESVDIGGPAMIRAAAKAALLYGKMIVVVDPSQYDELIEALRGGRGDIPSTLKRRLAEEAFRRTAEYDTVIYRYLANSEA